MKKLNFMQYGIMQKKILCEFSFFNIALNHGVFALFFLVYKHCIEILIKRHLCHSAQAQDAAAGRSHCGRGSYSSRFSTWLLIVADAVLESYSSKYLLQLSFCILPVRLSLSNVVNFGKEVQTFPGKGQNNFMLRQWDGINLFLQESRLISCHLFRYSPTADLGIIALHSTDLQNSLYMCWLFHNDCVCFTTPVSGKKTKPNCWLIQSIHTELRLQKVWALIFDQIFLLSTFSSIQSLCSFCCLFLELLYLCTFIIH